MTQKLSEQRSQAIWIARENIGRFEEKLKREADTCERKLLEGLIAIERAKLNAAQKSD